MNTYLGKSRPQGNKFLFMLNSNIYQEIQLFSGSNEPIMLFFLLIYVKILTIVGIFNICEQEKLHAQLS